jgi:hypothetical protein
MTPQRQSQRFPSGPRAMISAFLFWATLLSALVSALPPRPDRHHHLGLHGHQHRHEDQIQQFPEYDPPAEVSTAEASTMPTATAALGDSMATEDRHVLPTGSIRTITLPIRSKMPIPTTPGDAIVDLPARDMQEAGDDDMVQLRSATTRASTRTITLIIATAPPISTSPVDLIVDSPARGHHVGVDVGNEAQVPLGRTRTITIFGVPTATPVDVVARTAQTDDEDSMVQMPTGRTRTITIFGVPTATSPAAPIEVFPDTKEMARDPPAPAAVPVNVEVKDHNTQPTLRRRVAAAIGRQQAISDSAIWFFLASFGVFMTGVAWSVYVHVGMERERRLALELALSDQELGKGRGGGTALGNGPDVELARVPPAVQRVPGALF